MDYIEDSMKAVIDSVGTKHNLTEQSITYVIYNALCCLTSLEKVGIVHRDMKPANILVDGFEVKIIDFGLARLTKSNAEHDVTRQRLYNEQINVKNYQ